MSREGLDQGWWRAPRWLGDELIDRRLTAFEFALVSFIASRRDAEPERDGYATSIDFLRRVLRISDKTVRRTLKRACSDDLLVSNLRQGQRTLFRVWIGPRLRSSLRSETTPSVTEVTSVTGAERNALRSAPGAESREEPLRSSRARIETEKETETAAAVVVGEDLARLLLPLETRAGRPLTGPGLSEVARAFDENPDGVRAVVKWIERAGTLSNPPGALVAAIRSGEHRQAREVQARAVALRERCPECETGGGYHVEGCSRAAVAIRSKSSGSHETVPAAGNHPGTGTRPLIGEKGYLDLVFAAFEAERITEVEREQAEHAHRFLRLAGHEAAS